MAISRAQLAAALLEYDNEEAPPSQQKYHRQSALFTHFQPHSPPTPQLPSPRPESSFRQSPPDQAFRQSRRKSSRLSSGSFEPPLDHSDPVPDVSLDRWDLPSHLVSTSPPARTISRLGHISTGSVSTPVPPAQYSPAAARAVSIHLDHPDLPPEPRPTLDDNRRRTISFDLAETRRRTQSSSGYNGLESVRAERVKNLADQPRSRSVMGFDGPGLWDLKKRVDEPRMIPLPSSPGSMRMSFDLDRTGSVMDSRSVRGLESRSGSAMDARSVRGLEPMNREEEEELDTPNPFALPAPPPTQASRFDPKFAQSELSLNDPSNFQSGRPTSQYTRHRSSSSYSPSRPTFTQYDTDHRPTEEEEQEIEGFIPLSRPTYSDIPSPQDFGKPLIAPKYRRLPPTNRSNMLRPKTLIMPTSLTMAELSRIPPRAQGEREGWVLGEKPLPREARSSILTLGPKGEGKDFGKSLAGELRAMQEVEEERAMAEEEERERRERAKERPPGRLYGRSLMDQLEARKQYTKNKQRVFTGDSRPSMFARPTLSTSLSATSSLATQSQPFPSSIHPASPEKAQPRGPLLQFDPNHPDTLAYNPTALDPPGSEQDGNATLRPQMGRARPGMINSRSVFGVDELWEKEMKKLALIQAEEEERLRIQAEKEAAAAEAEATRRKKKGWLGKTKGKGKGKGKEREEVLEMDEYERVAVDEFSGGEVSPQGGGGGLQDLPPMLEYSPEKPPAPIPREDSPVQMDEVEREKVDMAEGSDTSDEDDVPLSRLAPNRPYPLSTEESDSDEDVPLSRIARPPHISTTSPPAPPTAPLVLNSDVSGSLGLSVPALPPSISPRPPTVPPMDGTSPRHINLNQDSDSDSEDDDKPLALRVPTTNISQLGVPRSQAEKEEIEDDLPLGFKHPTAVQSRQVSGSASVYGLPQQQHWGGMPGIPYSTSMYGMPGMPSMGGYPGQWGYGSPMIPGMPIYGHPPMGMSPSMGMGMGGGIPGLPMSGQGGPPGLGPPGLGPGQNIDSWRKGVRAPSSINGESGG